MKPCKEHPNVGTRRGYVQLKRDGVAKFVHRSEWEKHFGPIPEGMCVCHKCDNPPCYEITHLFLGTVRDNINDMVQKGRQAAGEAHGRSKLSSHDVAEIRRLYSSGEITNKQQLGRMYGVTGMNILHIIRGETW